MRMRRWLMGITRIPVITIEGDESGNVVTVVAGIHGDELVGPIVAQHLVRSVKIKRGVLHIIPAANAQGLSLGMRGAPIDCEVQGVYEGKDLNRLFPGWSRSKIDSPLGVAWLIYDIICSQRPTVVIDLHNWVDPSEIFAIVDRPRKESARLAACQSEVFARKFGARVVRELPLGQYVKAKHHRSLTGALVNRAHIPAFTVELGDLPRVGNIGTGIVGVLNVLRHCNMLPEGFWTPRVHEDDEIVMRLEEARAPIVGIVRYDVKPGKLVFPGTRLARCAAPNGKVFELKTKRVGLVLALGPMVCKKDEPLVTMAVTERRASWKKGEFGKFLDCKSASTNT